MIKKLNDEAKTKALQLAKAIDAQKCNDKYSDGYSDAMKDVCKYYDAQIDAQAKTLEELFNHFYNHDLCRDAENFVRQERPSAAQLYAKEFGEYVGFFLATGGRIKE